MGVQRHQLVRDGNDVNSEHVKCGKDFFLRYKNTFSQVQRRERTTSVCGAKRMKSLCCPPSTYTI